VAIRCFVYRPLLYPFDARLRLPRQNFVNFFITALTFMSVTLGEGQKYIE
jgi:hypothetical protein